MYLVERLYSVLLLSRELMSAVEGLYTLQHGLFGDDHSGFVIRWFIISLNMAL